MTKFSANEIRNKWIKFFKSKDHLFIAPASLIPVNDPTLLWINSGVATLKDYFTGKTNAPHNRLVNSQKSIRTNDITNVGVTARHHTIFEMLGNFSIGDYFKEDAIIFAYELLTKVYKMSVDKLYITVFNNDQQAFNAWVALGIKTTHIAINDKSRNFWDIGQGPCGPCTEIYYDRGEKYDPKNIGTKLFFDDIENDRYVEIWNIVFSEFNNDGENNYTPLARKNIDTGAGLERLASILQNVPTNFDTDLFMPTITALQAISKEKYDIDAYFSNDYKQNEINRAYRVVVDHLKAVLFALADGAVISNKERGSVLRRLIRRALLTAKKLKPNANFVRVVISKLIETMQEFYPQLSQHKEHILHVCEAEQEQFKNTIEKNLEYFNKIISQNKNLDADTVFKLVETYGFPIEIIKEKAAEQGVSFDESGFKQKMEAHKKTSRANLEIKGMSVQATGLINFTTKSTFIYDQYELSDAKIIGLFDDKFNPVEKINNDGWVIFDKTIFYATSGGQIHDEGFITVNNNKIIVDDVIKCVNGQHAHHIETDGITITKNSEVNLDIDRTFREKISKNHTVEHLLEMVLNQNISSDIKQEGAFKSDQYLTFDFKTAHKLTKQELKSVEDKINDIINTGYVVQRKLYTLEEAQQLGVIGHFVDVYKKIKEKLNVIFIGDINKEICGGTHVNNTKEIERFMIIDYSHKSADMWRIRAITSNQTIDKYIAEQIAMYDKKIKVINDQYVEYNIHNKEYDALYSEVNKNSGDFNTLHEIYDKLVILTSTLFVQAAKQQNENAIEFIKNTDKQLNKAEKICYATVFEQNNKNIISALNDLTNTDKEHLYFIINKFPDKIQYIAVCNKSVKISCGELIKKIGALVDGSGGGGPCFAQGGVAGMEQIDKITSFINDYQFEKVNTTTTSELN